jgi:hypothetical protein
MAVGATLAYSLFYSLPVFIPAQNMFTVVSQTTISFKATGFPIKIHVGLHLHHNLYNKSHY